MQRWDWVLALLCTAWLGALLLIVLGQYPAGAAMPAWVQYGGPYFTGFAAIVAATLATIVALTSIRANRQNLIDQMVAQRKIAARTARASVVSANRQRWIDGLREDLATFIAADFVLVDNFEAQTEEMSAEELLERHRQNAIAKRDRRTMQRRIQLRLNFEKPHHKELYDAVREVIPAVGSDHRKARTKLIKSAQFLLRQEWIRLKKEAGDFDDAVSQ